MQAEFAILLRRLQHDGAAFVARHAGVVLRVRRILGGSDLLSEDARGDNASEGNEEMEGVFQFHVKRVLVMKMTVSNSAMMGTSGRVPMMSLTRLSGSGLRGVTKNLLLPELCSVGRNDAA